MIPSGLWVSKAAIYRAAGRQSETTKTGADPSPRYLGVTCVTRQYCAVRRLLRQRRDLSASQSRPAERCDISLVNPTEAWQFCLPFSETSFMAYAIIQTGGKQYRVAEGDVIEVEKL